MSERVCPRCGAEFRAGIALCSDCGVPLVAAPDRSDPRFDRVESSGSAGIRLLLRTDEPVRAELVAAALEEAGIPLVRKREYAGGLHLPLIESSGIATATELLFVPEAAWEEATQVLEELPEIEEEESSPFRNVPLEEEDEAPSRSAAMERRRKFLLAWLLFWALLMLAIAVTTFRERRRSDSRRSLSETTAERSVPAEDRTVSTAPAPPPLGAGDPRDAETQFQRGQQLLYGLGKREVDPAAAAIWFRRAADQGHARAQSQLGVLFETGKGLPADRDEALLWYGKAASQGLPAAQVNVGLLLMTSNPVVALESLRKAARSGNARAMSSIGYMTEVGLGTAESPQEAVGWYGAAAVLGDRYGQMSLGRAWGEGIALDQDLVRARWWLSRSAANGTGHALPLLDRYAARMTPMQIFAADDIYRWEAAPLARPPLGPAPPGANS